MFKIPNNNQITQPNTGDFTGSLVSTRNIDLSEVGKIKLAPFTVSIASTSDDSELDGVCSMFRAKSSWGGSNEDLVILSDDTFRMTTSVNLTGGGLSNETTDESAPAPQLKDDVIFFNDEWVITDGASIYRRDGGSWTSISGTPVGIAYNNVLAVFPGQNSMLVGNGNEVAIVDTNWNVTTTLVLPSNYIVSSIDCVGTYAYIGVLDESGNEGALVRWTGTSSANQGIYPVNAPSVDSVKRYNQSVVLVTSYGELLYFTGANFRQLGVFPIYSVDIKVDEDAKENTLVPHRGMWVDRDNIYIAPSTARINAIKPVEGMYGGIWCYTPGVGLYHKYSATRNTFTSDTIADTDVNTTTNIITTTATVPPTGTAIMNSSGSQIGGLDSGAVYYVIKVTDNTFKLASSPDNAITGNEINLTSATTGAKFFFLNREDYGTTSVNDVGRCISKLPEESIYLQNPAMAFDIENDSGTYETHVCAVSKVFDNRGEIITSKIRPSAISSNFSKLAMKYKKLRYGDKIIVKYRTSDFVNGVENDTHAPITWTDSQTFTTTEPWNNVQAGNEIFVISGAGSGQTFTIASIELSAGTFTVTIEETNDLVSASDESRCFVSNWTKITEIDHNDDRGFKEITTDIGDAAWIQYKIDLQGTDVTIEELIIDDKPRQ